VRTDPINGIVRHHEGIDLPAFAGSPVMATGSGIVRIAGWVRGYGNLVEIQHSNGVSTRYGHLSRLDVFPSEHVTPGQVIGEVGSTGHSTGPHLHYEVRVAGVAVDPLRFSGGPAETYGTIWGPQRTATARGGAWSDDQSLPESLIR
jgi:murein DD-endopeptidase MepM/ murein hydrolase activator NlpD